jgi:hypothetical protein
VTSHTVYLLCCVTLFTFLPLFLSLVVCMDPTGGTLVYPHLWCLHFCSEQPLCVGTPIFIFAAGTTLRTHTHGHAHTSPSVVVRDSLYLLGETTGKALQTLPFAAPREEFLFFHPCVSLVSCALPSCFSLFLFIGVAVQGYIGSSLRTRAGKHSATSLVLLLSFSYCFLTVRLDLLFLVFE